MKRIWIDFDNSPHVPFFRPIIRELESRGYAVVLTARDCFQTCGLADLYGFKYFKVGRHYGKNKFLKGAGTIFRALQLIPFIRRFKPDIAISHGSRAQLIASNITKIPMVELDDYEHSQSLGFIKPTWKIVPEVIANEVKVENLLTYPGIKEDVYVPDFSPDASTIRELGLEPDNFIVTIRPPATEAHYHNPEAEVLFQEVVDFLGNHSAFDVKMVILPRNEVVQTRFIREQWPNWCSQGKIIIPEHVVKGLDLIWYSDLVISGGGTMNREAAALGVPVYSIFRGPIGAVDRHLSETGRLVLIESPDDVKKKIKVEPRQKSDFYDKKDCASLEAVVNHIIFLTEKCSSGG